MFAGPNGSGKTTLLRSLSENHFMPLGFNLNPDDVALTLDRESGFRFADWGATVAEDEWRGFCAVHPMGQRIAADHLRVADDQLYLEPSGGTGYLAAVLCDFLRKKWVAPAQSFTYEPVMSSADKVDLSGKA